MWQYSEFETEIDGVMQDTYTLRGIERLEHLFSAMTQSTCVFMFGTIAILRVHQIYYDTVSYIRQMRHQHLLHPVSTGTCGWCNINPARVQYQNYECDSRIVFPLCYVCHGSLNISSMPSLRERLRMVKAECRIYATLERFTTVIHGSVSDIESRLNQCPFTDDACDGDCVGDCTCEHICEYTDFGYYDFSYRAARMKWICDRVLEMYLLPDVIMLIVGWTLSGIDCKWNQ